MCKQKAWNFMYLNAIISNTKYEDKIYTMQKEIKKSQFKVTLFVPIYHISSIRFLDSCFHSFQLFSLRCIKNN